MGGGHTVTLTKKNDQKYYKYKEIFETFSYKYLYLTISMNNYLAVLRQ